MNGPEFDVVVEQTLRKKLDNGNTRIVLSRSQMAARPTQVVLADGSVGVMFTDGTSGRRGRKSETDRVVVVVVPLKARTIWNYSANLCRDSDEKTLCHCLPFCATWAKLT